MYFSDKYVLPGFFEYKTSIIVELWNLFIKEEPVSSLGTHNLIQRYYSSVEFGFKY